MKTTILTVTLVVIAGFALGCVSADGASAAAAAQRDMAKAATKEAAREVEDYAYSQKAEFVATTKKNLVAIHKELDRLSARITRSGSATMADAKAQIAPVREKWVQAKMQLDQVEAATESTWDDVKCNFKASEDELNASFQSMLRSFGEDRSLVTWTSAMLQTM